MSSYFAGPANGVRDPINVRKWLPIISWEGAFANIFITLTGGAFLTGLALYLGANDMILGLLVAIPYLAQIAQLYSAHLVDRTGHRKMISFWCAIGGRQIWWLIVPLVFLSGQWRITAFVFIVALASLSIMVSTPAWMAWMADIIPGQIRGRYFGIRSAILSLTAILATFAGGIALDIFRHAGHESHGFAIITSTACLFAGGASALLIRIPDRSAEALKRPASLSALWRPLSDDSFRHLLRVASVWNFAVGICAAFFAAHMLTNLRMSFTQVSIYNCVPSIVAIAMNRPWGILIDRFGSRSVMLVCAFGLSLIPAVWLIPRPGFLWLLGVEAVYSGALWAGFNLATFIIPIAASPREGRAAFLAMFAVIPGLAFFASSLLGGILAQSWATIRWDLGSQTVVNYHLLFVLSALLRFLAALVIMNFHEPSGKEVPEMLQYMGNSALRWLSFSRLHLPGTPR